MASPVGTAKDSSGALLMNALLMATGKNDNIFENYHLVDGETEKKSSTHESKDTNGHASEMKALIPTVVISLAEEGEAESRCLSRDTMRRWLDALGLESLCA